MRKQKLQIIVLFQNLGEERPYYAKSPSPPLSGILLAALIIITYVPGLSLLLVK